MELPWLKLVIIVSAIWLHSIPEISARGCGSGLRLRATEESQRKIDLSKLSQRELQKLAQQLAQVQAQDEQEQEQEQDEGVQDGLEQPQAGEDFEEDNRGSSRPWNRVQRIIRRQLVKIPKKYLRKILRQFGLARSAGQAELTELEEYYLIPLE